MQRGSAYSCGMAYIYRVLQKHVAMKFALRLGKSLVANIIHFLFWETSILSRFPPPIFDAVVGGGLHSSVRVIGPCVCNPNKVKLGFGDRQ